MLSLKVDDETELRSYRENDAEELFAQVMANFEHLRPFLHWVNEDYSLETAREFIIQNKIAADDKQREGLGIFRDGRLVGSVGFVRFDWIARSAEIGYWISKKFEGKGVITKSCKTLINYAFGDLEMNRIEIRCATENVRSRAIPEKLGFQLEGILRQSLWRHTRLYDVAVYGILAAEWREKVKIKS